MDKPMQEWTSEEWAEYDARRIADFGRTYGYMPVRSKNCSGCASWPYAMCRSCHVATHGEPRPPPWRSAVSS